MKYIIDTNKMNIPERLLGITLTGVDPDEQVRMTRFDIGQLEELTESYISEHFEGQIGEALKNEYRKGLSDGREKLLSALVAFLQMDADTRREWFGFHDILDLLVYLQSKLIVKKNKRIPFRLRQTVRRMHI